MSSLDTDRFFILESLGSRSEQEDAAVFLADPATGNALLVVCDGVGGSRDGGGASRFTTQFAEKFWAARGKELRDPNEDLAVLCREAHEGVLEWARGGKVSARTTVVALYLAGDQAWWAHSGDSRLYHFRAGKLLKRTRDHSVVEVLVQQGMVKEKEMGSHPDQGRLLQSIGGPDYKEPSLDSASTTPEDAFLLCTDGFWERTTEAEMAEVLYAPQAEAKPLLAEAVQRAVERNGAHGDNLTVAVALPQRVSGARRSPVASAPGNAPAAPGGRAWLVILLTLVLVIELIVGLSYLMGAWMPKH